MDNFDDGKFIAVDDNGNAVECELLFIFESDETKKSYIVYTDKTFDADGRLQIYSSVYNIVEGNIVLSPIETEQEWGIIEIALERVRKAVND